MYRQDYVLFLRAVDGKIAFLTEYFDAVRAARALDAPILGAEAEDSKIARCCVPLDWQDAPAFTDRDCEV
jgi:hypothetical protein